MGRRPKRAEKIRREDEFDLSRLSLLLKPPTPSQSVYGWTLEEIRAARDDQMRGMFARPVRLADAFRTDDALFPAYQNRLAPQRCVAVEVLPADETPKAAKIRDEAIPLFGAGGIGIRKSTLASINGTLANHGIAIGYVVQHAREDGSRVDFDLKMWPLEWVRWSPLDRCLMTTVDMIDKDAQSNAAAELRASPDIRLATLNDVPILHADGRWCVFAKHEHEPWKQEAALLPAALVWARHAFAARDWARGSTSHGNAKVVGEMPEGVALANADGSMTAEAAAFLALLQAIASVDSPAGIRPSGSKTDYITDTSTAWQVWSELMNNADKAAARIYLGTDGTLGAQGGAPGVDISALFGVATTMVQGDLECIENTLHTGVIEPWCAINFGDSALAPRRRYMMPDTDAQEDATNYAARSAAFHADVASYRSNGFVVDQDVIDRIAAAHQIEPPTLLIQIPKVV